jgi:hypothetical protein
VELIITVETTPRLADCLDCGVEFRIEDVAFHYVMQDDAGGYVGACDVCPTCAEAALADDTAGAGARRHDGGGRGGMSMVTIVEVIGLIVCVAIIYAAMVRWR